MDQTSELPLRGSIGNVIIPTPEWPEYVMDLIADCVNVMGTVDEDWHWGELEETMRVEAGFRSVTWMC